MSKLPPPYQQVGGGEGVISAAILDCVRALRLAGERVPAKGLAKTWQGALETMNEEMISLSFIFVGKPFANSPSYIESYTRQL